MGNQTSIAFDEAAKRVQDLKTKPSDDVRLRLYALFKQVTAGDNERPEPSILDVKAREKWKAWNGVKGMSHEEAEKQYILLVEELEREELKNGQLDNATLEKEEHKKKELKGELLHKEE